MKKIDGLWCGIGIVFVFSAVLGITMLSGIKELRKNIEIERGKFVSMRDGVAERIDNVKYLEANHAEFTQLLASSEGGAKRKVALAEHLEAARAQFAIHEMSYEIYPLRTLSNLKSAGSAIAYEEIEISLGMIHETRLVNFLDYIDENSYGNLIITLLQINRLEYAGRVNQDHPVNLQVNCTMRWYMFDMGDVDVAAS